MTALKKGKLWYVYTLGISPEELACESDVQYAARVSLEVWHKRFGHCTKEALIKISELELKRVPNDPTCGVCAEAKIVNPPFPKKSENRSEGPLDLIHTDVGGHLCSI